MVDKMELHVFYPRTDSLSREGEFSSCSHFCAEDGESEILAPQDFHRPSFRSALLMTHFPRISFAVRMETGLLTFEIFYFKIRNLSAICVGFALIDTC